jgi:hypothetical protein
VGLAIVVSGAQIAAIARIAAFMPGASPPLVNTATRFIFPSGFKDTRSDNTKRSSKTFFF